MSTIASSLAASLVLAAGLAHAGPVRAQASDDTRADSSCCTKDSTKSTEVTGLADPEGLIVARDEDPETQSRLVMMTTDDDGSATKVVVINGKVDSVTHDGKPVSENRIKRSGDTLTILGDDGETIASFKIGLADNAYRGAVQGDGTARWSIAGANPDVAREIAIRRTNQPKVFMGINLSDPDPSVMDYLGIESAIRVDKVIDDTPAERAGLQPNDLIIAIDSHDGLSSQGLSKILADNEPGDTITLKVIRKGKRLTLPLTLTKYPTKLSQSQDQMSERMMPRIDSKTGTVTIRPQIDFAPEHMEVLIEQLRDSGSLSEQQLKELHEAIEQLRVTGPQGNRFFGNIRVPGRNNAEQFFTIEPGQTGAFAFSPLAPHAPATQEIDRLAERLERLEQKLDKIERLLDRLADERQRGN